MLEVHGNMSISEYTDPGDMTITLLAGSSARVIVPTNFDFIVKEQTDLVIEKDGDVCMVILDGGTLIVKSHVKSITHCGGSLMIYPNAKIDIIHRSLSDGKSPTISFVDGADPNQYKIVTNDHTKDKTELQKALGE